MRGFSFAPLYNINVFQISRFSFGYDFDKKQHYNVSSMMNSYLLDTAFH